MTNEKIDAILYALKQYFIKAIDKAQISRYEVQSPVILNKIERQPARIISAYLDFFGQKNFYIPYDELLLLLDYLETEKLVDSDYFESEKVYNITTSGLILIDSGGFNYKAKITRQEHALKKVAILISIFSLAISICTCLFTFFTRLKN